MELESDLLLVVQYKEIGLFNDIISIDSSLARARFPSHSEFSKLDEVGFLKAHLASD